MKKPSIAYLIYNTKHCGGNKVVFEHVNRLLKRNYDVKIFTIFGKQPDWFPLVAKIKHVSYYFFSPKPDILVPTFWPTSYLSLFLSSKRKIYFVLGWEEEFSQNKILRLLAKYSLKLPFEKLTISQYLKNRIVEFTRVNKPLNVINAIGIDLNKFKPINNKHQKKNKNPTILSVLSSYTWYKGVDLLEQTITKLKENHPEYEFILVSSSEKKSYSSLFDKFYYNVTDQELIELYQNADVFLSTGRSEGLFIPGIEALACGSLFVSTNSGGILDYAENNKNAIIVTKLNSLWEEDIIEKFIKNKPLIHEITKNGLKSIKKYSWEKIIISLENIYNLK